MTRNRKLAVVVIGVLAVGGAAAAATAELNVSSPSLSGPGLSSSQQKNLERGINAPAVATEADVLATGLRGQFMERGEPLLPPGSHLRIDVASFRATSGDTATVDAVVTGPATGHWRLLLIRQGGSWLLIGTRKLP
jgi:hypothetical protein